MAGETGSAREEAERLVATVLAMTQQSGRRGGADGLLAGGGGLLPRSLGPGGAGLGRGRGLGRRLFLRRYRSHGDTLEALNPGTGSE